MMIPKIERSRVDDRWCVYTKRFEGLCSFKAIPIMWMFAFIYGLMGKRRK